MLKFTQNIKVDMIAIISILVLLAFLIMFLGSASRMDKIEHEIYQDKIKKYYGSN